MARKKKSDAVGAESPSSSGRTRNWSIRGEEAENGFIVHASHESKDGYKSKNFIAPNERSAIRIATAHIAGMGGAKKKGKGKKGRTKLAIGKRG